MAERSPGFLRQMIEKRLPLITGALAVALIFMIILFFLQWFLIREVFSFAANVVEDQLIQQAPEGVDEAEIRTTFERVKEAITSMPMSYITGKVSLRKVKASADYALKSNEDKLWTAEEVNTLLKMMNAAVGYKR
jgi:hypothetical protein